MHSLKNTIRALLATPLALGLPSGAALAAPVYSLTDLGTLGGMYSNGAVLNETGQIAGFGHTAGNASLRGALSQDGAKISELIVAGSHVQADGINGAGAVAGRLLNAAGTARAFVLRNGATTELPTLGGTAGRATAINDSGVVTGAADVAGSGSEHAFVWNGASVRDLGTLGGANSQGSDINATGQIVGYAENASRITHAALWTAPYSGAPTDLGTLGGSFSEAHAVNAGGQVTGVSSNTGDTQFRGFVWQAGVMTDIGALTANSPDTAGLDINSAGDVVGYSTTSASANPAAVKRAIVRKTGTTLADLNGLILPGSGFVLTEARAINDNGQIVGIGTLTPPADAQNVIRVEQHAVLLTPDRTPPTISTCPAAIKMPTVGQQPLSLGSLVATDNLDPAPVITNNKPASFPTGDTLVTWTVTDAAGNASRCTQLVTLPSADSTPPVVTAVWTPALPDGLNGWYKTRPVALAWSVLDPESAITLRTGCTALSVTADTAGTTPTCSATSAGGPSALVSTTIKLDATAPTVTAPANVSANLNGSTTAAVNFPAPTATDALSGVSAAGASCTPASGSAFKRGTTPVSCSVSDNAGNTGSAGFNVTVTDPTEPVITPVITPAAGTPAGQNGWHRGPVSLSWTVSDPESPEALTKTGCAGLNLTTDSAGMTDTCAASSAGNNGVTVTQTQILKVDATAPVVVAPAAMTVEATGAAGAAVAYAAPGVTEAGSGLSGAAACTPASGTTFAIGTRAVACAATDQAGNSGSASFNVTVRDTTAPALNLPGPLFATTTNTSTRVTYTATANDLVSGARTVSCTPASNSLFNQGTTTVNCSASDVAGNIGRGSFTVTVSRPDTTAPVLSLPASITTTATSGTGAIVTYTATATDAVSGARPVTCAPASGSLFPVATTTVNCSATDAAGNTARGSFTVRVNPPPDTTAPVLSLPASITTPATSATGAIVTYTATATDAVSGARPVSCTPASGAQFAVGTTTVNCSAADLAGNTASGSFTVTVNPLPDTTAPVLSLPANITTTATSAAGAIVTYTATATDAVSGPRPVSCTPASGAEVAVGTTTVNCSATDLAGNTASGSFTVTVNPAVVVTTADLRTTVVLSNATPRKGDNVTYTFTVANIGNGAAAGTVLTDVLPTALRFASVNTTAGSCTVPSNAGGGTVRCSLGSVAAGASVTVTVTAKANDVGVITNGGSATTTVAESSTANNAASATLTAR
jgi:uncharacterized repeat protein (TIGR01451 family)